MAPHPHTLPPHDTAGHLQLPATHESGEKHGCPQAPQLLSSDERSTHAPEQSDRPALHTHAPFTHEPPASQVCVVCQVPVPSHVCTAAVPLHWTAPGVHATHTPLRQTGVEPPHTAQVAPQRWGSDLVS
jgi:hypothetical protein